MKKIENTKESKINRIYSHPDSSGLAYKIYGKSQNINDYSALEISQMMFGIYKDKKYLLVDGAYFLNLKDVIKSECILQDVTYIKKPTKETLKNNSCNLIENIRTFYVKDYFLITQNSVEGNVRHKITDFLNNIGTIRSGRGILKDLFSVPNDYKTLQNGTFPKDLYDPIKKNINSFFFNDAYKISEFEVISTIIIYSN